MEHYMNAVLARAPWCAADGNVGPWLCARGCRDGVGRGSTQRHQGLWAMPVAPSCCASSPGQNGHCRSGPCFQQRKRWHEVCKPMVERGDKNPPDCCLQGIRGHGKTDTGHRSGSFLIVFPLQSPDYLCSWKAMALLLQTKHSPALQSLQPNCTHPGGQARIWGQESCLWSVCQKCCLHEWLRGSWEAQLPVPSPLCSSKPRHVFTRVRANS